MDTFTTGAENLQKSARKGKARFTPKYIRSLICPNHMKQVYVSLLPDTHLYASVGRAGRKSFCFRCKLDGNWRTLDLDCRFDDKLDDPLARLSMKKAEELAAGLTARVNRGENPFDERKAAITEPTLQELFDAYIERHVKKNGKRINDIVQNFSRWFEKLAKRKASSISQMEADKFHGFLNRERGPYAANRAVQLARAVYNKAKSWKLYCGENPFAGITLFPEESRDRVLSDDEAAGLIDALADAPAKHCDYRTLRDFILLDMSLGVRKSCMLSMEWAELDDKAHTWAIPASKAKNSCGQVIKLGQEELNILAERKQLLKAAGIVTRFVFPGSGKSGHVTDMKHSWTSLRKKLNLTDVTIHDLRRSLAASMANTGANIAVIKGALNHKDMATTVRVYARTNTEAQFEARQTVQAKRFRDVEQLRQKSNNVEQLHKAAGK